MSFFKSDGSPILILKKPGVDAIVNRADSQELFEAKLDKYSHPGGCWLWTSSRNTEGYGNFTISGQTLKAHRVAYRLYNGPITPGMVVMHACDNPPCCNPAHLSLGTWRDNVIDKYAKGRGNSARGDRNGARLYPERLKRGAEHNSKTHPESLVRGDMHWTRQRPHDVIMGEDHKRAKLTREDVTRMRELNSTGRSAPSLAKEFGVTEPTAYAAISGMTWKFIPGAAGKLERHACNRARGERVNTAVLREDDVREIRTKYAAAKAAANGGRIRAAYDLASEYGVSRGIINRIVSRERYGSTSHERPKRFHQCRDPRKYRGMVRDLRANLREGPYGRPHKAAPKLPPKQDSASR